MSAHQQNTQQAASSFPRRVEKLSAERLEAYIAENVANMPMHVPPPLPLMDKISMITDDLVQKARLAFAAGFPYRADHYAGVPASPPKGSSISGPSALIGRVIDRSS